MILPSFEALNEAGVSIYKQYQAADGSTQAFEDLYTVAGARKESLEMLRGLGNRCLQPGWDGYDAMPINPISYQNAVNFIDNLPYGIDAPRPTVDPRGFAVLEWRRPNGHLLSVTFDDQFHAHCLVYYESEKAFITRPVSYGYGGRLKDHLSDVLYG